MRFAFIWSEVGAGFVLVEIRPTDPTGHHVDSDGSLAERWFVY